MRSGDDAIVYCGSGLTAALDLLAIRVAGFGADGRLYGGSWSGWIEDPSRPVATGDPGRIACRDVPAPASSRNHWQAVRYRLIRLFG